MAKQDEITEDNLCTRVGNHASLSGFNIYSCVKKLNGRYITIRRVDAVSDAKDDRYVSICEVRVNTEGTLVQIYFLHAQVYSFITKSITN